jgi:hypothetical protein
LSLPRRFGFALGTDSYEEAKLREPLVIAEQKAAWARAAGELR